MDYCALQQMLHCSRTEELPMIAQMQEFVSEQSHQLATQVSKIRKESVETAREAALGSAENIKSLKAPVRTFARSGIKLTNVTQSTMQSLIELQSDMITSALTDMAHRLERASRADDVIDLVRDQIELVPATRDRIVEDGKRAVEIFKHAGRDLRGVAKHTYERVVEMTEEEVPAVKKAKRKAKTATRKAKTATRKAKAPARKAKTTRRGARAKKAA
jgi:phasin family protein